MRNEAFARIQNDFISFDDVGQFDYSALITQRPVDVQDQAIRAVAADDYRDSIGDTTAAFGSLSAGGSATGSIETRGDHDLFSISLAAGQRVVFNLTGTGLSDPLLRLMSSTGSVLATNDDFGSSRNSQITYTATSAGTYYLDAGAYNNGGIGTYRLSASGTPAATDDYRDSVSDTTAPFGTLTTSAASTGRVETSGDKDLFSFAVTAGQTYTFNLNNAASGGLSDPLLRLLNTSGGQIAVNDDFGSGRNSQITYTATSTGTVYLEAGGYQTSTGNYSLTASGSTPPTGGGFDIVIRYSGDPQYQALFDQAAARWEEVITGDIPNFNSAQYGLIDDLMIDASITGIDGAGGILGQAGPDTFRSGSLLPAHGIMEFDSADIASLAGGGSLFGVILHEMGHVLGLGTLWDDLGLKSTNTRYTGSNALAEYRALSGNANATYVPLENNGGAGTAGGHWEEDIFNSELMTGYANGSLAMSRMTIASLKDIGYQVNLNEADPYVLGQSARGLEPQADMILGLV